MAEDSERLVHEPESPVPGLVMSPQMQFSPEGNLNGEQATLESECPSFPELEGKYRILSKIGQ
eukprot:g81243.t1